MPTITLDLDDALEVNLQKQATALGFDSVETYCAYLLSAEAQRLRQEESLIASAAPESEQIAGVLRQRQADPLDMSRTVDVAMDDVRQRLIAHAREREKGKLGV
ncbi:MAG: hypothetical protein AAF743_13995 [Planctomycetota bacterium]